MDRPDTTGDLRRVQQALGTRYHLEREIGRGGMAVVYLARDARHQRAVAVKVLKSEIRGTLSLGAQRFVQEIRLTAQLQHPHILPLFDSGGAGDEVLYYVTPFIDGESLRQQLDRESWLPVLEALRLGREVADALGYAHQQQIIHRDIKPGNILLAHGHALVADFGIARALAVATGGSPTETGAIIGTPAYMSPEQRLGDGDVDPRSDVYSLGCVLFEMLTGQLPFTSAGGRSAFERCLTEDPPAASALRPDVPRAADQLLARALARRPANRFATARELWDALGTTIRTLETPRPTYALDSATVARRASANLGPCVARTCDRWSQLNAFDASFRAARATAPGRTQVYVVHGEEGHGHESLVERLVATRLLHYAAEIAGEAGGTVLNYKVAWPSASDVAIGQRDLAIALFREVAPGYMGEDLSAATLAGLVAHTLSPIVAIQHELRAGQWNAGVDALIQWYLTSFWGTFTAFGRMPLFVVFLKIVYPAAVPRVRFAAWLRGRRLDKRTIAGRVQRSLEVGSSHCRTAMLNELTPVTLEDVQSWFDHNHIYESEHRRREVAASLFRSASARPLAEVELALQRIHTEFVRHATRQQGTHVW